MNLQPVLENEFILARPLREVDLETLYEVAADPRIWDQHPNKNRYKRKAFENFFKGAMASEGAYIVFDKQSGKAIGSSRYYDWNPETRTIFIGYTFFSRENWGKKNNFYLKSLMINHAFTFADRILFHIGAENYRSQRSVEKLNARKLREVEVEYYGEPSKLNVEYVIEKTDWMHNTTASS